ncbi:hypothetical protein D3C84_994120 [compost metagenome]
MGDGCHQRHFHGLADHALVLALFVDDGFVVVELDGHGLAVLDAHLHQEVGVGFAGGDLGLDHGLQGACDHAVHRQGIDYGTDEAVIYRHCWVLFWLGSKRGRQWW